MRTLALWFPDWPVQAAIIDELTTPERPTVIAQRHTVYVCDGASRRQGIRRGMKLRHAQALLPTVTVIERNDERDGRIFTTILDGLDAVVASAEVLRPGLVVVNAEVVTRYYGSEDGAAEKIIDAAALIGVDCFAGIADDVTTAIIAAHAHHSVPAGGSIEFLARQPIAVLKGDPALGCELDTVLAFENLGLSTLGQIAALDAKAVATRFGHAGTRCRTIARGEDRRVVARAEDIPDMSVSVVPEEPITRVDEAAFMARSLAATLHTRLANAGLSCVRLKVQARSGGTLLERIWHTLTQLTEASTADRIRWQLDGWLTAGGHGAIDELTLIPLECEQPQARQLWGRKTNEHAHKVISRVQSTLGLDAVVTPTPSGGRGVAERITLMPYGERSEQLEKLAAGTWPGAILGPLPALIAHPASKVTLVGKSSRRVYVTADATLNTPPAGLKHGPNTYLITGWAGPWPVQEKWWKNERPIARLQLVGTDRYGNPHAWLLIWCGEWRIEATYE